MTERLQTWRESHVARSGLLFKLELEPSQELVELINRTLNDLAAEAAEVRHMGGKLRIFGAVGEEPLRYEYWYPHNDDEQVIVNRYDEECGYWWSEIWSRPKEDSIPWHLRERVDRSWRIESQNYQGRAPGFPKPSEIAINFVERTWSAIEDERFMSKVGRCTARKPARKRS